jgi:hypothetical protein
MSVLDKMVWELKGWVNVLNNSVTGVFWDEDSDIC